MHAGYGQQGPVSTLDAWVCSLSILAGMFLWTYLTSVFITLLIHMNAASSEYTVKSAALDSFMSYRRLPKVLSAVCFSHRKRTASSCGRT